MHHGQTGNSIQPKISGQDKIAFSQEHIIQVFEIKK